jgi:hypothetical protein
MAQLLPPPPSTTVTTGDDDSRQRLQFRLWQMLMATLTVMVAVWFTTYGPVPAILAWVTAKHILVAILMMGLDRYPQNKDETEAPRPGM